MHHLLGHRMAAVMNIIACSPNIVVVIIRVIGAGFEGHAQVSRLKFCS